MQKRSAPRGSFRLLAAALLVFAFPLLLTGCKVFGNYDNPVDPGTANYQGHVSATTFEEIAGALPDIAGSTFAKVVVPEWVGASDYEIRLAGDAADPEASTILTASASSNELSLPQRYLAGKRYSYQFRAQKGGNWSPWSAAAVFELSSHSPLAPSPADGGSTTDTTPTLSWTAGTGETAWVIQTATETAALDAVTPVVLEAPTYSVETPLAFGSTLYWRAAPKTDVGLRVWSKVYSVTVSDWSYSLTPTPANGATTSDTSPLLDWDDIGEAASFELQIANSEAGIGDSVLIGTETSSYQVPAGIELGSWYWRVRGKNVDGVVGPWSPIWSLSLSWTYSLTPMPADAGTTSDTTPLLDWNDVADACGYELQLADTDLGVVASTAIATAKSEYQIPATLALGEVRYWRVRAKNADGVWGAWSATWSFTVSWTYSLAPVPADGGTTSDTTPLLDWNNVSGASGYELQIADSAAAVAGSTTLAVATSEYQLPIKLALGDTRYWRVRVKNVDGVFGAWSASWSFSASWIYTFSPEPVDAGTTSDTTPLLDWNDIAGADGYELQLADTSAGVPGSAAIAEASSQYQLPTTLAVSDVRYWRVRAKNADGVWGAWGATWSLSIRAILIGDTGPAGGLIFYDKGSISDGWRYMEAAPSDQSIGIPWGSYINTGANATGIGSGKANTAIIVSVLGEGSYAASICDSLVLGGYDDWFLPSIDELYQMYENLKQNGRGDFAIERYWSSSEGSLLNVIYNDRYAWNQSFADWPQYYNSKGNYYRVRAAREF